MKKFKSVRTVEGFRDRTVAGSKPTAIVPGTSWDGIRIPAIGSRISVKANGKWYEGVVTYSSNFYVDVKVDRRGTSTVGSDEFTTRLRKPQMTESFRGRTASGKPLNSASSVKGFTGPGWYVTNPVANPSDLVDEIFAGPYYIDSEYHAQAAGEYIFGDRWQEYSVVYLDKDGVIDADISNGDGDSDYDDINDPPY